MEHSNTVQCPLCKGAKTRLARTKDGGREQRKCYLCEGLGETAVKTALVFQRLRRNALKKLSSKPVGKP